MNNSAGLDQFVRNQITFITQFAEEREFLSNDRNEIYALDCLQRAVASASCYFDRCLNDKKIIELGECLAPIDNKVRCLADQKLDLASIKKELKELLAHIEENTRLNQDSLPDKLMGDVVVLEKSEFGDRYDHVDCALMYKNDIAYLNPSRRSHVAPIKFTSKRLPGYASTPEAYDRLFSLFNGCIESLSNERLRLLIADLNINLPSDSLILPHKEYIPLQILVDLPRLSHVVINGKSMLDSSVKEDKDALFCTCMQAMEEEVEVALGALKLVTQATLARPTYVLYTGFQNPETMTRVSQALDIAVSIKTHDKGVSLKQVEVRMWAFFGIIKGEVEEPSCYLGVMRKLLCTRDFLRNAKNVKGSEGLDVYSPMFQSLEDLKRCDFDVLGEELRKGKVFLV